MSYCQTCGGANVANATTCRICGHLLSVECAGAPCQSGGAPTVDGAMFCSLCGTATVVAPSSSLSEILPGSHDSDTVVATERQTGTAQLDSVLNLGEGLDFPDWLERAAEQPIDPGLPAAIAANPSGPLANATATLAAAQSIVAVHGSGLEADPTVQPPLLIPETGPEAVSGTHRHSLPSGGGGVMSGAGTAPARAVDLTDTSSFISEDDLPDWIRQLAAAVDTKKLEEMRRAADVALADRQVNRRERADGPETVVAVNSRGAVIQASPSDDGPGIQPGTRPLATDSAGVPDPEIAEQSPVVPTPAASNPDKLRLLLFAAFVFAVVALLAFLTLS